MGSYLCFPTVTDPQAPYELTSRKEPKLAFIFDAPHPTPIDFLLDFLLLEWIRRISMQKNSIHPDAGAASFWVRYRRDLPPPPYCCCGKGPFPNRWGVPFQKERSAVLVLSGEFLFFFLSLLLVLFLGHGEPDPAGSGWCVSPAMPRSPLHLFIILLLIGVTVAVYK